MGGREEIDARIEEVKRLVYCALEPFFGQKGYEVDDILQEGILGVLKNGHRFDPERGSLSTFVTVAAQTHLWTRRFQADARNNRRVNFEALSLDMPLKREDDHGEARCLGELIPDGTDLEADVIRRADAEQAYRLIDELDERTAEVIRRRYKDEPDGLKAIGADLGLTGERVRQLEASGLRRLKRLMKA